MEKQRKACSKCLVEKDLDDFSKMRANSALRRASCKACQLARDNRWRDRNRAKVNAAARKYALAHPGERTALQKLYKARHPERVKETHRRWMAKNRKRVLARRALVRDARKRLVVLAYSPSGICSKCGEKDIDVLCVDHVNNDGSAHRRQGLLGTSMYSWLIKNKYPAGFQILCANCNLKKSLLYMRSLVGKEKGVV